MQLANKLENFSSNLPNRSREEFEFDQIEWKTPFIYASGSSGPAHFRITLGFAHEQAIGDCSLCGPQMPSRLCVHTLSLMRTLEEEGIAENIEENNFEPCSYGLVGSRKRTKKPKNPWKSRLDQLAQRLDLVSSTDPTPVKFPGGREAIYVIQAENYYGARDTLEIIVATRPSDPAKLDLSDKHSSQSVYRNFSSGLRALAASVDPLDREIAERLSLATPSHSYSDSKVKLTIAPASSGDLLARLARSGRLYFNNHYVVNDNMLQLDWIADERFDVKFEIAESGDGKCLDLGLCAAGPTTIVRQGELRFLLPLYFIDAQNRIGLFCRAMSTQLFEAFGKQGNRIQVPREHAGDLIERVMGIPLGLGIEFNGCDDLRPQRQAVAPRPMIHIKAPLSMVADVLEATVQFDYGGLKVLHGRRVAELYDKQRGAIVPIDQDFHERSISFLHTVGIKIMQRYNGPRITLPKKRLPRIVAHLIHNGWHVEADGKLYRSGSKFDINIVSGIDWFELQGKAHFDQTSIDLPRLLQALRSGEKTIVLDDGTIGVIPEAWIKQFSSVADLGTSEDGSVKFGRSQVGLLDALLAERGEINVDEKFEAARQSLRAFDRIAQLEPPAGFIGELRPYQKLAQGWFEFLRNMGFGGCLADDMGLGKTVQVLSLLEHRRQQKSGPSLIVVPRSLIFNWTAEAKKFAPKLRVLDQSHSQRTRGTEHLSDYDLVLTTYGTLRRDAAFLKDFEFDYVVLDEAQAIKNATTEASKAARLLKGRHKLALSGTPIENHLGELWSLFDFLNPGMLGRVGRFATLATDADVDDRKLLAAAVRPFILRRTKKQVAPELPERVEQTIVVEMEAEQRRAYDELRDFYRQSLLRKIDTDGIGKSQIVILEALLRLRQAACHPGLIDKSAVNQPSAKLDELLQRLSSAIESGERVLVFSQFTSFLAIVKQRLKMSKIDFLYLDGKTRNRQELVEQFQSGTGPSIFLISLKAGGVGLNLTAARTVYLLDPWWNPAVEAQAIDRSHRIGQQQTVFAARLIAADTVEQKVLELQAKKKGLADAIVNADNSGISSLTKEDLELLLA